MVQNEEYIKKIIKMISESPYHPSPNPHVACLIVKNNKIIGTAIHKAVGQDHAEILAIENSSESVKGADLYVNLEPCCHYGRTPPCVERIVQEGIKRVFIAIKDPNPLVDGKGVEYLRSKGLYVQIGICEKEAYFLNRFYFHYIKKKMPYVIAKWAMSIDGRMSVNQGDNRYLTDKQSVIHTHQTRKEVDAILIGATTANSDNPMLTARYSSKDLTRQPKRIILSGRGTLRDDLKILNANLPGDTIVVTSEKASEAWLNKIRRKVEVVQIPAQKYHLDLRELLAYLAKINVASVLVEGGRSLLNQFIDNDLVNQIHTYLSPYLIGKNGRKKFVDSLSGLKINDDYFYQGYLRERK